MLVIPILGLYISLALWGSLIPVPWVSEIWMVPSVRQLHGTVRATAWSVKTLVGDLTDLAAYAVPRHKVPVYVPTVSVPKIAFGYLWMFTAPTNDSNGYFEAPEMVGFSRVKDFILIPPVTSLTAVEKVEMSLSVVTPLWEETGFVPVSKSPMTSAVVGLVFTVLVLAFTWLLWKKKFGFSFDASALGVVLEELGRLLEPSPKVARVVLGSDETPSVLDTVVALVEQAGYSCEAYSLLLGMDAPTGSVSSETPLEGEVLDVWIHPRVEAAIMRLERQRAVAVVPELEFCITKGWTAGPSGADGALTERVLPAFNDAPDDYPLDHLPQRVRWALVPRRLETLAHDVVLRLLWALLTSWEGHIAAMAIPVPVEQQVAAPETPPDEENAPRRRRNRPSQAARRRKAKRALAEQQEALKQSSA
ncbi:hypothetical protein T310_7931 [Rasamsonia emersonii CBS 393.64]|uniref:Uncharacterized protein n=1 Tax=Rasamsonia emersonii (strain ATCC 16479 / CBS 393.64 / IMI 116815) TaxID=1408163 RepID=A0A0F4YJ37_RASE3|nr:hypothetical protein T310_7931 [Rasamsonia emersonii CBS 393.64]KKA18120.1 hypothetical protein T310_7931 [Rasamsonia emersonii CBS 393.64]